MSEEEAPVFTPDAAIAAAAGKRNKPLAEADRDRYIDLDARYLVQMAHLTTPATRWSMVEKACTKSAANLVMLDMEDSTPRGDDKALHQARWNVIRAYKELGDWGGKLKFFRPRGLQLDPEHTDIAVIVEQAGAFIDGLIYPKTETAAEVRSIDETLTALERKLGLPVGKIKFEVLIESVSAEEQVFEIAQASRRLVGLIFGAYDYWASLGMIGAEYRADHPMVLEARSRIQRAAASVGLPAIAEMTLNYPTKDKTPEQQKAALDECRRDAEIARDQGYAGKWTGIPAQVDIAKEVLTIPDA
ncbi:MAG: hypothetical protein K8I02_01070, partial [Candidatus Methylomirabilis sp.]|nr:hypothetical protein [Deltaproteobacteria bacterium]